MPEFTRVCPVCEKSFTTRKSNIKLQNCIEYSSQQNRRSMTMKFDHVFAGEGMWCLKEADQGLIERVPRQRIDNRT